MTRRVAITAASTGLLLAAALVPCACTVVDHATTPPATKTSDSAAKGSVTAARLLAKLDGCAQVSHGEYRTDAKKPATVPVCRADGAVFWKADMDVDCDGQRTAKCNENTDPWYQDDTAFHQSDGRPLKADSLPYVVVPGSSSIWDHGSAALEGGGVVAVVYRGKVEFAVVGDTGPSDIIGEASYATASALGIDPNPRHGGTDSGVTYILFENSSASPIESHREAVSVGRSLAARFLRNN